VRPLGQGAFSAVWLAEDLSPVPLAMASKESVRDLRRKASLNKKSGEEARAGLMEEGYVDLAKSPRSSEAKALSRNSSLRSPTGGGTFHQQQQTLSRDSSLKFRERVRGTRPAGRIKGGKRSGDNEVYLDERDGEMGVLRKEGVGLGGDLEATPRGRAVAVKMTAKRSIGTSLLEEERTRVGFVREVEVLRVSWNKLCPNISFPNSSSHCQANHMLTLTFYFSTSPIQILPLF
jgi:protein-serine/threonine kinase